MIGEIKVSTYFQ